VAGGWALIPGALLLATMFFCWFGTVIGENQQGIYNDQVDRSFRMGMIWFIFSEVMFFAAFFGALFLRTQLFGAVGRREGVKVLNKLLLWKNFNPTWPTTARLTSAAAPTAPSR